MNHLKEIVIMQNKEVLSFIEDKDIEVQDDWYIHATQYDIETVKKILNYGIKCAHLMGRNGNHFNGKYYISLYKPDNDNDFGKYFRSYPKFIISGITPHYADRSKMHFRKKFVDTKLPLRTSEWDGEYQEFLKIDPSNFVAFEYSLFYLLNSTKEQTLSQAYLHFLRDTILYLEKEKIDLPIYDLSSNKEINKEKTLSLF